MTPKSLLSLACLIAVAYAAVPMDMRGPGDENCAPDIENSCDPASTHCVQIKYYLAAWEFDEPDAQADKHKRAVVCMCKRGYTPSPDDESACRSCEEGEACHEGDMNPEQCGHNSCDYYSARCVPDVDSFLGFYCTCQDGFVANPYNPLKCSYAPYVNVKGHKVTTKSGEEIWSGSYGDEQYSGEYVDATRDAHVEGHGGTVHSGAHQYVASTHEDYMPGTDFFSENGAATSETTSTTRAVPAMAAVAGGVALLALAVMATYLSRKPAAATLQALAEPNLTPANTDV